MFDTGAIVADRYELLTVLGGGGSGVVYAALDRVTEKRVAAKLLGRHILDDRSARARLKLEACISGRVSSEHVVQVTDAGIDTPTGVPYLIMELLEGKDLQQLVDSQGALTPSLVVEYLRQIALGLDKAHRWEDADGRGAPIVHRDLKPSNLFLTFREDGSPQLKILDFGLAKVLAQSTTLSGELRGTPLYMAPEQLAGTPLSPATDVWALALIAFFLLTGRNYWRTSQRSDVAFEAVLREVGEGPTDPPSSRLREFGLRHDVISKHFDRWFLRCAHRDPRQRFPTAGEAVRALALALEVRSPQMVLTSDAPSRHPSVSNWLIWTGTGAAVGLLGWFAVSLSQVLQRAPHPGATLALSTAQPRQAHSAPINEARLGASAHALSSSRPSAESLVEQELGEKIPVARSKPKATISTPVGTTPPSTKMVPSTLPPNVRQPLDPTLRARLEDPLAHR